MRSLLMTLLQATMIFSGGLAPSRRLADEANSLGSPVAALHIVSMTTRDVYAPSRLTIRAGDSVRWINRDNEDHTVTADPSKATNPSHFRLPPGASIFDSGNIAPGMTFTKVFTIPGNYIYFCVPHQNDGMIGTLQVLP
jgi:plastocyanin